MLALAQGDRARAERIARTPPPGVDPMEHAYTFARFEELGWLLSYSPYHAVRDGTSYPAVLFTVFEGDSRVDPLHARKTCAALQAATSSDAPVLLRNERDVGHGARSVSRTVGLSVDTLTFLATHTGLDL